MKLKAPKKMISPTALFGLIFIAVLALEAYLLYTQVYGSLLAEPDVVSNEKIVRLDLTAYNKTIQLLDKQKQYIATLPILKNINPFR